MRRGQRRPRLLFVGWVAVLDGSVDRNRNPRRPVVLLRRRWPRPLGDGGELESRRFLTIGGGGGAASRDGQEEESSRAAQPWDK